MYTGYVMGPERRLKAVVMLMLAGVFVGAAGVINAKPSGGGLPESSARAVPPSQVDVLEMERVRDLIVVPIEVSGSPPLSFVLDSGTPTSTLNDLRLARELNLRTRYVGRALGFAGKQVSVLVAPDVSIRHGGTELLRTELAIHHVRSQLVELGGLQLDGLLGGELFAKFVVEIDPDAELVRLHDPAKFRVPEGASRVRLRLERGVALVRADVMNAEDQRVRVDLLLDTGSETVVGLLSDSNPRLRAPDSAEQVRVVGVGGAAKARVGSVRRLEVGDVVVEDAHAAFFEGPSLPSQLRIARLNGVLGARFLLRYHTWIDYPHRQLLLIPRSDAEVGPDRTVR